MPAEPIRYYHRAKQVVETEQVYGESWLRWTYGSTLGRFALWLLVKRAFVSRYYGWKMSLQASAIKVLPFIVDYDLDVDEFAKKPYAFKSFNEFFFRALKPGARPVSPGERIAVLPADGRHLAFPVIEAAAGFRRLNLTALPDGSIVITDSSGKLSILEFEPLEEAKSEKPAVKPGETRLDYTKPKKPVKITNTDITKPKGFIGFDAPGKLAVT
ncbi:MAG: phosphatidylserine decarboxylase, partial [Opitutae bacterium]